MASITKRPNGKWRARYRDISGKEYARHFDRKIDGQRWLDEVTASIQAGTYVDPKSAQATVHELANKWRQANPSWSESTRVRNVSILTRHVEPRWGSVTVSAVTFESVQHWVAELSATGLAGGTVRKIVGVLSSIMRFAVRTRRLPANPVLGVDLPKQALSRRRYLSAAEVETLAEAANAHADIVLVLAYCGLRIGELAALKVGSVNMLRRRLQVDASVTEVNGVLAWSTPKDHQRRSVPFPAFLADALGTRMADRSRGDVLFTSTQGEVLRVRNMRRDWFDAAATAAGLRGLTPHELRHTAASLAVSAGASVLVVQRMLGHEKPSMTLDVYADLFDADLDDVADRLGKVRAENLADSLRTASR